MLIKFILIFETFTWFVRLNQESLNTLYILNYLAVLSIFIFVMVYSAYFVSFLNLVTFLVIIFLLISVLNEIYRIRNNGLDMSCFDLIRHITKGIIFILIYCLICVIYENFNFEFTLGFLPSKDFSILKLFFYLLSVYVTIWIVIYFFLYRFINNKLSTKNFLLLYFYNWSVLVLLRSLLLFVCPLEYHDILNLSFVCLLFPDLSLYIKELLLKLSQDMLPIYHLSGHGNDLNSETNSGWKNKVLTVRPVLAEKRLEFNQRDLRREDLASINRNILFGEDLQSLRPEAKEYITPEIQRLLEKSFIRNISTDHALYCIVLTGPNPFVYNCISLNKLRFLYFNDCHKYFSQDTVSVFLSVKKREINNLVLEIPLRKTKSPEKPFELQFTGNIMIPYFEFSSDFIKVNQGNTTTSPFNPVRDTGQVHILGLNEWVGHNRDISSENKIAKIFAVGESKILREVARKNWLDHFSSHDIKLGEFHQNDSCYGKIDKDLYLKAKEHAEQEA